MNRLAYRIELQPEDGGRYTVTVPALPGCITWGENYAHALAMAQDAIRCYIESLAQDGEPIPIEDEPSDLTESRVVVEQPASA
jgi:antitoxin HicB